MKRTLLIGWAMLLAVFAGTSHGAETQPAPAAQNAVAFKPEELEQIVAPIALYPDALLAQVFMASTYPLEIVQAARWSKEHPDVKGDAVAKQLEGQSWDPSVKSLAAFPDVLAMMSEKIDWTQKLGDAFLAQQKDVMAAVQRLRAKAKDAGNLKSGKEQVVKTEPAPAGATTPQIIVIESKDPEVVYVPTYNPTVVYGTWPYPAYPPYYYYPPAYVPGAAFFSFSVGVIVGGAIWGDCNWGGNDIDIDIDRYNNFNRNEINTNRDNIGNRAGTTGKWQHDSGHRKGVGYRDTATQQKYGRASSQQAVQSREQFRGHAEQGRQQIAREGATNQRDLSGNQIGTRDGGAAQSRTDRSLGTSPSRDLAAAQSRADREMGSSQYRDLGGSQSRTDRNMGASQSRDYGSSRSSDAFSGVGNGASTRANSSRGMSSRSSAGMSRGGGRRR
ncbi:MAG TPA: DUF3300 domain-containing protein [Povalibacter sp.]|uniref:DUF3300 domain-containing protein n=1 Tax=Povalibacter sp. TaxID=1962978 RepID=UPI002D19CC73|nr:DUF3300 domain-containing protein [Povalibacter sp.]HMN45524.1 DUF3300 domain-containing protein [Povalibacter sp.]